MDPDRDPEIVDLTEDTWREAERLLPDIRRIAGGGLTPSERDRHVVAFVFNLIVAEVCRVRLARELADTAELERD